MPEGKHLLIENSIEIKGDALNLDEVNAVIRQKPNLKLLGIHFRLRAYNAIDSTKLAVRVERRKTSRTTELKKHIYVIRWTCARKSDKKSNLIMAKHQ